jgi:3-oxoacyl-[acyl-carrier-protein] synthase III
MTPRLGAISYHLGEIVDIGELPELRDAPDLLALFRNRGLSSFSVCKESVFELASRVGREAIARARLDPTEIDAVFFVTETQKEHPMCTGLGLATFLVGLGLHRAYPCALSGSQCANVSAAVRIGSSLIRCGEIRHILVVVVEKLSPDDGGAETRLTSEPGVPAATVREPKRVSGDLGMTVCSDGAAAFVLSADAALGYEVARVGQAGSPDAFSLALGEDFEQLARRTAEGTRRAVEQALAGGGDRARIRRVLTNNCGLHIQRQIMANAGFSMRLGFFENIARFAHAFSVDNLVNLIDADDEAPSVPGDEVMLLFCAVSNWGAVRLRRREGVR